MDLNSDLKKKFLGESKIVKLKMYSLLLYSAKTASQILTELEQVGISNVLIDRTSYSNATALIVELKTLAITRAKDKANKMAAVLSQKIGKAIYISDTTTNNFSEELQGRAAGLQIRGASSIYGNKAIEPLFVEFDKLQFSASVKVKFALE